MAEGFKNFTAGQVLGESDLDEYLMSQTVMRFADASARNSALSGVLTEGLVAYLKDVNTVTIYSGSAWVTVNRLGGWPTYTPTCFQEDGTGQTLTVVRASYQHLGRDVTGSNILTVTAAGSATNGESIIVSMPIVPSDTTSLNEYVGIGKITDATGPTNYPVAVVNVGGAFRFLRTDTTPTSYVGVDPGFALANGDTISFSYQYESLASA